MSLLAQAVILADSKDVDRRVFEIMLAILKNNLRSREQPTSMGKWMIFVDEFKTKGDIQRFQTGVITFATLVHGLTQVQAIRVFKEHDSQDVLVELIKACASHSLDAPMETFINTFLEAPEDEMFSYKRELVFVLGEIDTTNPYIRRVYERRIEELSTITDNRPGSNVWCMADTYYDIYAVDLPRNVKMADMISFLHGPDEEVTLTGFENADAAFDLGDEMDNTSFHDLLDVTCNEDGGAPTVHLKKKKSVIDSIQKKKQEKFDAALAEEARLHILFAVKNEEPPTKKVRRSSSKIPSAGTITRTTKNVRRSTRKSTGGVLKLSK
jgi:hypothetical protein